MAKKICPSCSESLGVRTKKCPKCDHVFIKKQTEVVEVDEETIEDTVDEVVDGVEAPKKRVKKPKWQGDKTTVEYICARCLDLSTIVHGDITVINGPVILTTDFEPNLKYNALYPKIEIDSCRNEVLLWVGAVSSGPPSRIFTGVLI